MAGAIVPHAPLLLPQLESPEVADAAARIRNALGSLRLTEADVVVVASPHGSSTGVYRSATGSLARLGRPDIGFDDDDRREPGEAGAGKVLDEPADHGVVVPLMLLGPRSPVVAVTFRDETPQGTLPTRAVAPDTIARVTAWLQRFAAARSVALIASAHTGAGLSPRAPLPEADGGGEAEERLVASITTDVGRLRDGDVLDGLRHAGACGVGSLALLGELFAGRRMEVHAREAPVGVGYLVAATT